MSPAPISFDSPALLPVSLAVMGVAAMLGRRRGLRGGWAMLLLAGATLLALAAGGLSCRRASPGRIAVLVDDSASTRSAGWRDPAALQSRLVQLPGRSSYEVIRFDGRKLPAVDADAIVLFSDGRIDPPVYAPPVYPVLDEGLDHPGDAAVRAIELRGAQAIIDVVAASPTQLRLSGATPATLPVRPGSYSVAADVASNARRVKASLDPGDRWPENDALTIVIPPPEQRERWWVGGSPPDASWRPVELPDDPVEYLRPSIIVVRDAPPDSPHLLRYIRDLGGGVLLPGRSAHADFSPLSGDSPRPSSRWVILLDASGSMASPSDGTTRWPLAIDALRRALPALPPKGPVSIMAFARDLTRIAEAQTHADVPRALAALEKLIPHGPTNLAQALEGISADAEGTATQIILIGDAQAALPDVDRLAALLSSRKVRLHLLAIAPVEGANPVERLVRATGGESLAELRPSQWGAALRRLLREARPTRWIEAPLTVRLEGPLARLGERAIAGAWRSWLRDGAIRLAASDYSGETLPLTAIWSIGLGKVSAIAYEPDELLRNELIRQVMQSPRDPRFTISWQLTADARVVVDAIDGARYMNGLKLDLILSSFAQPPLRVPFSQTAPGRYVSMIPRDAQPRLAAVASAGSILDRRALAGCYPAEFDVIGLDRAALSALAHRTGGELVEHGDTRPLRFNWPARAVSLRPWLASAGALLLAAGLVRWRLAGG